MVLVRRRKSTEEDRQTALRGLGGLRVRIDEDGTSFAFSRLSELGATHGLSVYDAAYLELAQRRKLALGCKDGPLKKAASRALVSLWKDVSS